MAAPKSSKQVPASGNARPPNAGKGRKKGVPNRSTREVREVIAEFAKAYAPNFEGWIDRVAETDPARAAELYLRSLEYHIPKLTRTHITSMGRTLEEIVLAGIESGEFSKPLPAEVEAVQVPATTYSRMEPTSQQDPAATRYVTPPAPAPAPAPPPPAPPQRHEPDAVGYRHHHPLLDSFATSAPTYDVFADK